MTIYCGYKIIECRGIVYYRINLIFVENPILKGEKKHSISNSLKQEDVLSY